MRKNHKTLPSVRPAMLQSWKYIQSSEDTLQDFKKRLDQAIANRETAGQRVVKC